MKEEIFFIKNLKELKFFSKKIIKMLFPNSFLLISGELGSGKTTMVQFIGLFFGIKENINSPTFNILNRYWIDEKKCFLNHFDFFNLRKDENISFFDDFKLNNINVIEWPEKNKYFWEEEKKIIYIKIYLLSNNKRKIKLLLSLKEIENKWKRKK